VTALVIADDARRASIGAVVVFPSRARSSRLAEMPPLRSSVLAVLLVACSGGSPPPSAGPSPSASASASAPPVDSTPVLAAIVDEVMKCAFSLEDAYRRGECPARRKWIDARRPHLEMGKSDAFLVSLLEAPEPARRYLGLEQLLDSSRWGDDAFARDRKLAVRILAAAQKEREPLLLPLVARAVGTLDLETTKLEEHVLQLMKNDPRPAFQRALVMSAGWRNKSDRMLAYLEKRFDDGDDELRAGILSSTSNSQTPWVCPMYGKALAGKDPKLALSIAGDVGFGHHCKEQYAAALGVIEKAIPTLTEGSGTASGIRYICEDTEDATQKKKGAALAKAMLAPAAASRISSLGRRYAAGALGKCDPADPRLKELLTDADEAVREAAKEALKGSK
jgi:hypothetical protein